MLREVGAIVGVDVAAGSAGGVNVGRYSLVYTKVRSERKKCRCYHDHRKEQKASASMAHVDLLRRLRKPPYSQSGSW